MEEFCSQREWGGHFPGTWEALGLNYQRHITVTAVTRSRVVTVRDT